MAPIDRHRHRGVRGRLVRGQGILMRQRGSILLYGLLALAILTTLSGIAYAIRESGKESVRVEWAAANAKAAAEAEAARKTREAEARKSIVALQNAQTEARNHENRWKALRRATTNAGLASCPDTRPRPENASTAVVETSGADSVLLTPAFVRLYDNAWTGSEGQPVFPDPAGTPETTPAARSVSPGEVLDVHAENASRCSENARQLGKLISLIERLRGQ